MEKTIFEQSRPGYCNTQHAPEKPARSPNIPSHLLRSVANPLPEVSELETVRHFTRLSQLNFSVDTHFYPLGSCTMKYNPRVCNKIAGLPHFLGRHPLAPESHGQGMLSCLYDLQVLLQELTGMAGYSLAPMAGAQGEFAGVAMIRAYHDSRGESERREILVPDASHGTNPATAAMCGYTVKEIATDASGDVDLSALKKAVGEQTAGLMLTNPSTLGVFERYVGEISRIIHKAGGLLYYDGANLNAIAGRVRPGDMGFDAVHLNVHKTFATPHGGGGPGAGPVGVNERLLPFLPVPVVGRVEKSGKQRYFFQDEKGLPRTIGRLSGFHGNVGILLRAYAYLRLTGASGMRRISEYSTLNANYLLTRLKQGGFQAAFPNRRATHEFIITLKNESAQYGVSALDFAKRLLDFGFYAPTIYFPIMVPECLLIEPTETESKAELDRFADALITIRQEAQTDPDRLKNAPHHVPVPGAGTRRLDDTRAARKPNLIWKKEPSQ